ncbi:MAG: helix-turn-helix transcriptional regulator [Dehalococcoidia bacterium]
MKTAEVRPLSAREREVLACLCDGDSNDEIARRLSLSVKTVEVHLARVYLKLGVRNRTQAVALTLAPRMEAPVPPHETPAPLLTG